MVKKETFRDVVVFMSVLVLFLLDILTKFIFTKKSFIEGRFISIRYSENYGSSFGIFSSVEFYSFLIVFLSIVAIVAIMFFYRRFLNDRYLILFFIFFLSGLLGNTFDRLVFGFVRDFIALRYLFIFNFADLYITIAFIMILIREYSINKKSSK